MGEDARNINIRQRRCHDKSWGFCCVLFCFQMLRYDSDKLGRIFMEVEEADFLLSRREELICSGGRWLPMDKNSSGSSEDHWIKKHFHLLLLFEPFA